MGAWDAGVFDNDEALDVLSDVSKVATTEIEGFYNNLERVGFEDIDCVLACIAIQTALINGCGAQRPTKEYAQSICARMMEIYDSEIDEYDPKPEYRSSRRTVLVDTLDQYLATSDV